MNHHSHKTAALIVAAGRGHRLGAPVPKQYLPIAGIPILRRTALAYLGHPAIDCVQVVIAEDDDDLYRKAMAHLDLPAPVMGGESRQASVLNGLEALASGCDGSPPDAVLIHDAVRPLVPRPVIDRVLDALARTSGAMAALPVRDTLARAMNDSRLSERDMHHAGTIDRSGLWAAQTPQGFRFNEILAAHRMARGEDMTDDATVAMAAGLTVAIVEGHSDAMKITTRDDLRRAEALLAHRAETRVGQGFDVHRLVAGRPLILCGVRIEHSHGLSGHSDADVGLHALTDAILGAIGDGDIGTHFSPSDDRWHGADSALFLADALDRLTARGGWLNNMDLTLICERPKIGPHRHAMIARLAELCRLDLERISIKATTTERLGFTGRNEGIAAQAIVTVALPGTPGPDEDFASAKSGFPR